jgi:transposase
MEAQTAFLRSLGVEVFGSGHRRWPEAVKAQAVAETLEPTEPKNGATSPRNSWHQAAIGEFQCEVQHR